MNILEYLAEEHINHRALFHRILGGEYSFFEELRSALVRHVRIEEEFLFGPALKDPRLEENTRLTWEEHNVIMELLQMIDKKDEGSPSWISKIRLLEKIHLLHSEEEEQKLFPLLSAMNTSEELERLAEDARNYRRNLDTDEVLYPEVPGIHKID